MADDKKDDVQDQEPVDGVSTEPEIDYAAELKKLKEAQASYDQRFNEMKETLSKRDSTISKLAKEKEALELEKLSESDRAEAERQKAIEEREGIKAETERLRRERDLALVLSEAKLDHETYAEFIGGNSADEMAQSAKKLNDVMQATIESRLDAALKEKYKPGNVKKPGDGPGTIDEQIREARKNGDAKGALRLQLEKQRAEEG